jgi:hypothetical protein
MMGLNQANAGSSAFKIKKPPIGQSKSVSSSAQAAQGS